MARIKGNTTPLFTLKVGAASAVDFGTQVASVEFADGDGNQVTMDDYASGSAPKQLNVTFVLDFATSAAFEYHWTNSGATGVTWAFQVSNGAVSQTNPKFTGTLTMPPKPNFSVEAGTDDTTWDVTYELDTYTKAIS